MIIRKKRNLFELLFYTYLALVLLTYFYNETTFVQLDLCPDWWMIVLHCAGAVIVMAKSILERKTWQLKSVILVALVVLIMIVNWSVCHRDIVLDTAILFLGAHNVKFTNIGKLYIYVLSSAIIVTIALAIGNRITSLVYVKGTYPDVHNAYALGFVYTVPLATYIFFLLCIYCWIRGKNIRIFEICILPIVGWGLYKYVDALTDYICLILLAIGLLIFKLLRKLNGQEKLSYFEYFINGFLAMIPEIACVLSFATAALYDENIPWMKALDSFLVGRFYYGRMALQTLRVTPFGQNVVMKGAAWITTKPLNYFFIDSSYIRTFYFYGYVGLMIVLLLYAVVSVKITRGKQLERQAVLAAIAVEGVIFWEIASISFCPIILAAIAEHDTENFSWVKTKKTEKLTDFKYVAFAAIVSVSLVIAGLSVFETISQDHTQNRYYAEDYEVLPEMEDCTANLQNLIDQLYSDNGGIIVLGEGTYKLSEIQLRRGVTIEGSGIDTTILQEISDNADQMIKIEDAFEGIKVLNLTLEGNKENSIAVTNGISFIQSSEETYAAIYRNTMDHILVETVRITDFSGKGIWIGAVNNNINLENVIIENNDGVGIDVAAEETIISNCMVKNNGDCGIRILSDYNKLVNVESIDNGLVGIYPTGIGIFGNYNEVDSANISGNYCQDYSDTGIGNTCNNMITDGD